MRVRLLALAALLTATSVAPSAAHAAYPGRPGRIAFEWKSDLWSVHPDGTGLDQLTTGGVSHGPRWSPSGRSVAFNRAGDIWVMAADGTGARRLTTGADLDFNATWSPDGTRIAFVRWLRGGPPRRGTLWAVPAAGGVAIRLTQVDLGCAVEPTWAAVGRFIAYLDQCAPSPSGPTEAIRRLDLQSGHTSVVVGVNGVPAPGGVRATSDGFGPDITPDGTHIVFSARASNATSERCDLAMTDLRGQGLTWLTGLHFCDFPNESPFVSPDGTKVGYVGGNEIARIHWVRLGSTQEHDVFNGGFDWIYRPDWQPLH